MQCFFVVDYEVKKKHIAVFLRFFKDFMCWTISWPSAVASWSLVITVALV